MTLLLLYNHKCEVSKTSSQNNYIKIKIVIYKLAQRVYNGKCSKELQREGDDNYEFIAMGMLQLWWR